MKKRLYVMSTLIIIILVISVYFSSNINRNGGSGNSSRKQASNSEKLTYVTDKTEFNSVKNYGFPQGLNTFRVDSIMFSSGEWIPLKYVCSDIIGGENTSIPIRWTNAPPITRSFALVMYDTNPLAKKFVHWTVINIPYNVNIILEGASSTQYMPGISIELRNSSGNMGYIGPCPPRGTSKHEYKIIVYALNTDTINLSGSVSLDAFQAAIAGNVISKAEMSGFFQQ